MMVMRTNFNKILNWFTDIVGNKFIRELLLLIIVWLSLVSLAAFEALPTPNLKVGEPSPKDIEAPRNFQMVDEGATLDARLKAAKTVGTLYSFEPEAITLVEQNISKIFNIIKEVQASKHLSLNLKLAKINQGLTLKVSASSLKHCWNRVKPLWLIWKC
jgi:membrane-associated HD superfamily phosphohydrolase